METQELTNYQRGYAMGERAVEEFGLEHALETSSKMRQSLHRLDMYGIGYRTAITVYMEKVWM